MLASRHNQENATHLHQTAAAAKPLNQTQARTPGPKANAPKTPFRNRNDENAAHTVLKTGAGKVKASSNLFVTPAPSKARAVLGAKTTNAKALQTPGQKTTQKPANPPPSTQKISPRLKRSRVRIHQPSPSAVIDEDADDSAPEIEYCPPPRILTPPLPNRPDEHLINLDDVVSDDETSTDFVEQIFRPTPIPDFDLSRLTFSDPEVEAARRAAVGTIPSRSAAAALSRSSVVPSFAAPTAATAARSVARESPAASRSTLGYAQGRKVSATKRAPLSTAHRAGVVRLPRSGEGRHPSVKEVMLPGTVEQQMLDEEFDRIAGEDFVLEM